MNAPFFRHTTHKSPRLFFIAGPCVIESEKSCLEIARRLALLSSNIAVDIVFKASFYKANRTSEKSFRGPGRAKGLKILEKVKSAFGLALLTDVHGPEDAREAGDIVDVVQIPALLCRQTDLLTAARKTGKFVNIKKGQFMAPLDMRFAVEKAGARAWLTERGTFFGYNRLVVDFAGLRAMKKIGVPVIFDATHSVQNPGAGNGKSLGDPRNGHASGPCRALHGGRRAFLRSTPGPRKGALRRP